METRAASIFDTCLEQALQDSQELMAAMGRAAVASLQAKLLDKSNTNNEPLLQDALAQLSAKKADLPIAYATRLREAVMLIAEGKRADYHQQRGVDTLTAANALESEVLRAQIEWGRVQIGLLKQTEQSLLGLDRVYRPLRNITRYWRNGNPLHHTVYLDTLQLTLHEQGITTDVTSLFLADMVGVMADYLQNNYRQIMKLAMNSYADLLAKAQAKRQAAKENSKTFARKVRHLFDVPNHSPVGAVRAYKLLMPVLARLSERDASFLVDDKHPARLLVQSIIDRAIAIKEGKIPADPHFPTLVSESVEALVPIKYPTAADFSKVLAKFGVSITPRPAAEERTT